MFEGRGRRTKFRGLGQARGQNSNTRGQGSKPKGQGQRLKEVIGQGFKPRIQRSESDQRPEVNILTQRSWVQTSEVRGSNTRGSGQKPEVRHSNTRRQQSEARGQGLKSQRSADRRQRSWVQKPEVSGQKTEAIGQGSKTRGQRCKHQRSEARGIFASRLRPIRLPLQLLAFGWLPAFGLFACGPYTFKPHPLTSSTKTFGPLL